MGRPVFHEYSLDELVAASLAVAVVERAEPRERTEDRGGLRAVLWPLRLVEVLSLNEAPVPAGGISRSDLLPPRHVPPPGAVVDVLVNRVNLTDQGHRRLSSSGASFPAQRYRSDPATLSAPRWIAFLHEREGELEFTAQGAFESLDHLPAVSEAIRAAEVKLPTRRAFRADLLAHFEKLSKQQ
jgi:hypothetical protein